MVCSVIKPQSEFIRSGCPNCEDIVGFQNSPENVADCTSANFNGVIALTDPEKSWVAKWQRLDKYVPGLYAVQVVGIVPPEVMSELANRGIKYVPRDGTKEEDLREEEEEYE
jgi:transcription elongation factor SPT4